MPRFVLAAITLVAVGVGVLAANEEGDHGGGTRPPAPAPWVVAPAIEFGKHGKVEARRFRLRSMLTSIPIRVRPRDCWLLDREPEVRLGVVETRSAVVVTASIERSRGEGELCQSYRDATIELDGPLGDRELKVGGFGTPYPAKRARL